MEKGDEERTQKMIEQQIARALASQGEQVSIHVVLLFIACTWRYLVHVMDKKYGVRTT